MTVSQLDFDPTATTSVAIGEGTTLTIPADATGEEVAAMVATVSAHLAADGGETEPEPAEPWSLAGRMSVRSRARLPRECAPDQAWAHAGRASGW
jgi:hypothetical protein